MKWLEEPNAPPSADAQATEGKTGQGSPEAPSKQNSGLSGTQREAAAAATATETRATAPKAAAAPKAEAAAAN